MKKILALVMAALFLFAAVGCGAKEPADLKVDTAALLSDLESKVPYPDEINAIDSSMADMLLTPDKLPEGAEAAIYLNSLSNVRILLVTCPDAAAAEGFVPVLKGFIDRQKDVNASYAPEEVEPLDNALLRQAGPYVVLVVSDDSAAAASVVDGYLK